MSALLATGIDNVRIEIDGPEVPIILENQLNHENLRKLLVRIAI